MKHPVVRITDLGFRWSSATPPVLDIPAFAVDAGEHVLLRGPSGSGKTTLLNLLGGVTIAGRGRIEVLGSDLRKMSGSGRDRFRAEHVGFVFQLFNLIPYLDLVGNVTLPCRFSATRRTAAQARSGSAEAEGRRLLGRMGLDPDAFGRRSVAELSVGQQQRVAAARALIGGPELIIADEPTSALDRKAGDAFLGLLFEEVRTAGSTLLVVSHDDGLAARFDRVVDIGEINRVAA